MITGVKSLSTVDIMNLASSQNIELKLISSANSAEIDTLKLDAKSIAEIKSEVAKGNFVNVPQENITVNKWTGTGYIITNPKTYESTYKITGGLNGGTTTSYLTVDYMANICFSVADYAAAFQLLTVSITAILAGGYLVGAIAMVGCVLLLSYAIENYFTSISLMYDSINGDTNAAKELENRAKLNSIFTVIGISSSIISKPIINSIAKTRLAKKAGTTALNVIEKFDTKADEALQKISSIVSKGYDEKTTTALLKDTKFLNYNDDLTDAILKTGKDNANNIVDVLSKENDLVIDSLNHLGSYTKTLIDEVAENGSKGLDSIRYRPYIDEYSKFIFPNDFPDTIKWQNHLEKMYIEVRQAGLKDVVTIAEKTGVPIEDVIKMKKHILLDTHQLSYRGNNYTEFYFSADWDIAYAWKYISNPENTLTSQEVQWFKKLSAHELTEAKLMGEGMPLMDKSTWNPIEKVFDRNDTINAHDKANLTAPCPRGEETFWGNIMGADFDKYMN